MIVDTAPDATTEPDLDQPDADPSHWWKAAAGAAGILLALVTIAAGVLVVLSHATGTTSAPGLTHTRWTEPDGRVCTAATAGGSVALSCAYRPLLVGSGQ